MLIPIQDHNDRLLMLDIPDGYMLVTDPNKVLHNLDSDDTYLVYHRGYTKFLPPTELGYFIKDNRFYKGEESSCPIKTGDVDFVVRKIWR